MTFQSVFQYPVTFVYILLYLYVHVYGLKLCCYIDPSAVTTIRVTEVCTKDFIVSWIAPSNEEELSYSVRLFPPGVTDGMVTEPVIDTSFNYNGLLPDTN